MLEVIQNLFRIFNAIDFLNAKKLKVKNGTTFEIQLDYHICELKNTEAACPRLAQLQVRWETQH